MGKETHGYSRLLVVLGKTYCLECRQPALVTRDRMSVSRAQVTGRAEFTSEQLRMREMNKVNIRC